MFQNIPERNYIEMPVRKWCFLQFPGKNVESKGLPRIGGRVPGDIDSPDLPSVLSGQTEENAYGASHIKQPPLAFIPLNEGEALPKIADVRVFTRYSPVGHAILEIVIASLLVVWSCIHGFQVGSVHNESRRDQTTLLAAYDLKSIEVIEKLKFFFLTQVACSLGTVRCFQMNLSLWKEETLGYLVMESRHRGEKIGLMGDLKLLGYSSLATNCSPTETGLAMC